MGLWIRFYLVQVQNLQYLLSSAALPKLVGAFAENGVDT